MKTTLKGSQTFAQQTLDLRHAEAAGHQLLGIIPELTHAADNTAELRPLGATEPSPAPLTLAATVPAESKVFWMGIIHVGGALTAAVAYR